MKITCNYELYDAADSEVGFAGRFTSERPKTALVVDDDPLMGELVEAILSARGFQVTLAESGREALTIMAGLPTGGFDLLFTDVCMPGMNGVELEKEVRKLQPAIKVIFCSGYAPSDLKGMDCEVLGRAFIRKPFCLQSIDVAMDMIEERELVAA